MEIFIIYLLKVIGLQALLFGLYWLLCRNSNRFHFNRYFLLSTLLLPFIIPMFKISMPVFQQEMIALPALATFDFGNGTGDVMANATIEKSQSAISGITWWVYVIIGVYLMIALPFAYRFFKNYKEIHQTIQKSTRKEISPGGFRLFYVPSKILSFSFLNCIFLSELFTLKPGEKNIIVAHEEYHLKQRHSVDIIVAECIRILCWFNPVILLIQKNLMDTHEFLTDRHTVNQFDRNEYTRLLRSFKYQEINMTLGHAYSSSSIQNRIKMMETKKSPTYKIVLLCAVTIFTSFLFACEDEMNSIESQEQVTIATASDEKLLAEIDQTLERIKDAPEDFKEAYKKMQLENPEMYYIPMISTKLNTPFWEKLKNSKVEMIGAGMGGKSVFTYFRTLSMDEASKYYRKREYYKNKKIEESLAFFMSQNRAEYFEYKAKENGNDAHVYERVDIKPRFKNGEKALANYITTNLKYPELAKQKGIEAEVTMKFVVGSRGQLLYLNMEKGPDAIDEQLSFEFQKAAYQVVKSTEGMWKPAEKNGKYVLHQMSLPIKFELNN